MSQVIWLPEALDNAKRLFHFLKDKNPAAAETLLNGAAILVDFPEAGRAMQDNSGRR